MRPGGGCPDTLDQVGKLAAVFGQTQAGMDLGGLVGEVYRVPRPPWPFAVGGPRRLEQAVRHVMTE